MRITPRRLALATALALAAVVVPPLAAQAAEPDSVLLRRAEDSRIKGAESAPIMIVELADFQCPFCREFATGTLAAVDSAFVATGKARMLYVNLPLPNHRAAWIAAEAALCAGAQGRFWPMHDRLYSDQAGWSESSDASAVLDGYASALGLDAAAFRDCTRNDRVAPILIGDLMQAAGTGVTGTPTFILLRQPKPGESPENAQRVLQGVAPFADFEKAMGELGS